MTTVNTATLLEQQAELLPNKTAIVFENEQISFAELDESINRCANYFVKKGIRQGMKVLLFVPPSIEFSTSTFALFKIGAIPVFIDPGMGIKRLRKAVEEVAPEAMVAVPRARVLAFVFRNEFKEVKIKLGCAKLRERSKNESSIFKKYEAAEDEMAAILFTSGGTGKPKGVVYSHKIFMTQTRLLQEMFSLTPADVDFPCFSLFGFFTIAMGLTSYIPPMDPSRPSEVNPEKLVTSMIDHQVTFAAGSPVIWTKVADYCLAHDIHIPTLKYLVMFGAPVREDMHEKWQKIIPNGTTYTPYGATEALPISNISGRYILDNTIDASRAGAGTCVGTACDTIDMRILNEDEIIVSGDTVTQQYYDNEPETLASKLYLDGKLFHKVGDVGRIDDQNRLWFWGRKEHVVRLGEQKMYPLPCETIFTQHPKIKRAALVGPIIDGRIVPSLVLELHDGSTTMPATLLKDLRELRDAHEQTKLIERFYLKETFPVDVRHNIKIDRLKLRAWAEQNPDQSYCQSS